MFQVCREKQNTHFIFRNFLNCAVNEIMWKDFVEPDEPQMTMWCRCIACWIPTYNHKHKHSICNTYWFSTTTLIACMCLDVTLYILACIFFQTDQFSHTYFIISI
jgi:hypothetical protein